MAANEDEDELYAQVRPRKRKKEKQIKIQKHLLLKEYHQILGLSFYDFKKQKLTSVLLSLFFSVSFSKYRFFVLISENFLSSSSSSRSAVWKFARGAHETSGRGEEESC